MALGVTLSILYLISGGIAYHCIFCTKINWENVREKIDEAGSAIGISTPSVSDPNTPIEKQEKYKNVSKNDVEKIVEETKIKQRMFWSKYDKAKVWYETLDWKMNDVKEKVEIKSFDGLTLKGVTIKNINEEGEEGDKWIVLAHGYWARKEDLLFEAKRFYKMGFNVLLIDMRAHGSSGGEFTSLGWKERLDIRDWVWFIANKYPKSKIVTFGVSMGATAVMLACAEKMPKNFKACIEDCGFDSLSRLLKYLSGSMIGFPGFLANFIISGINFFAHVKERSSIRFSVSERLKKAKVKVPILFLHGDSDTFVPLKDNKINTIYENYDGPKMNLIVKNAQHTQSTIMNPEKYWGTVENFLKKYLE